MQNNANNANNANDLHDSNVENYVPVDMGDVAPEHDDPQVNAVDNGQDLGALQKRINERLRLLRANLINNETEKFKQTKLDHRRMQNELRKSEAIGYWAEVEKIANEIFKSGVNGVTNSWVAVMCETLRYFDALEKALKADNSSVPVVGWLRNTFGNAVYENIVLTTHAQIQKLFRNHDPSATVDLNATMGNEGIITILPTVNSVALSEDQQNTGASLNENETKIFDGALTLWAQKNDYELEIKNEPNQFSLSKKNDANDQKELLTDPQEFKDLFEDKENGFDAFMKKTFPKFQTNSSYLNPGANLSP